jgi:hypothetical protein
MTVGPEVIIRMQLMLQQWEKEADQKAVFLRCYQMMTNNMLSAIEKQEFHDSDWVNRLLLRFADYYFNALEAYEREPASALLAWQLAFNSTRDPRAMTLQNLLLGVNAHINYDLVLALTDLLKPEWDNLSGKQRNQRYTDHKHVNEVIAATIDAVQDQVLEPSMPVMDYLDRLLGKYDEMIISRLLTEWRESVWAYVVQLLEAAGSDERSAIIHQVENKANRLGEMIYIGDSQRNAYAQDL